MKFICKLIKKLLNFYSEKLIKESYNIHSSVKLAKYFETKVYPIQELLEKINCD